MKRRFAALVIEGPSARGHSRGRKNGCAFAAFCDDTLRERIVDQATEGVVVIYRVAGRRRLGRTQHEASVLPLEDVDCGNGAAL